MRDLGQSIVRFRAFRVILIVAMVVAAPRSVPASLEVRFLGSIDLDRAGLEHLGGLSAIEVAADGSSAFILSDRGRYFPVQIKRDAGRILSVGIGAAVALTDQRGRPPEADHAMDSEGLARGPGGQMIVSFEGDARIAVHGVDGRERRRDAPPLGSEHLPPNGAYEALAVDARGQLYTLPEDPPGDGPVPLFRLAGGHWRIIGHVPRGTGFRPVALDFDDRGRLYLLERRFSVISGFVARMIRFEMTEAGLGAGAVMLETLPWRHGNLEGLSVWRDPAVGLIATMVADDNFSPLLPSQIVEYALPD